MSYKKLEIWNLAREVVIEIHSMTLSLPRFEMFEEGGQIRKYSKTVEACIAGGYGRRRYKQDWIKFLVYPLSSNDESLDHLENLWDTKFLIDETKYQQLHQKIKRLGKMINGFLKAVEKHHESPK